MPKIKFLKSITLCGSELPAGTIDEVDDISAEALVRESAAEYVEAEADQDNQEGQQAAADQDNQPPAVDLEMVKKALDAQYKADELKTAAKEIGVEFPYDAKKADVIEAVIEADKAAALLK